jgi:hypothetical protein
MKTALLSSQAKSLDTTKGAKAMTVTPIVLSPRIAGKALYLELVANPDLSADEAKDFLGWQTGATRQVILFPEYADSLGNYKPAVAMVRTVSTYQPKAQWDFTYLTNNPKPKAEWVTDLEGYHSDYYKIPTYSGSEWSELPEVARIASRALAVELWLKNQVVTTGWAGEPDERVRVAKQAWVVRESKPIAVEITDEDLESLDSRKTPQAVIRRINKVRDTLDKFPKKLA